MWANRITLDFVKHDAARAKIQSKLDEKGITDECITDLHIFADSGYVGYKVTLSDKSDFTIFDDGNEIKTQPDVIRPNSYVYFVAPKDNPNYFGLRKLFLDEEIATKYWKECGTEKYTIWREAYYIL